MHFLHPKNNIQNTKTRLKLITLIKNIYLIYTNSRVYYKFLKRYKKDLHGKEKDLLLPTENWQSGRMRRS